MRMTLTLILISDQHSRCIEAGADEAALLVAYIHLLVL